MAHQDFNAKKVTRTLCLAGYITQIYFSSQNSAHITFIYVCGKVDQDKIQEEYGSCLSNRQELYIQVFFRKTG